MKYVITNNLIMGKLYKTNGFSATTYFEDKYEIISCASNVCRDAHGYFYVRVLRENGKIYNLDTDSCDFCEI